MRERYTFFGNKYIPERVQRTDGRCAQTFQQLPAANAAHQRLNCLIDSPSATVAFSCVQNISSNSNRTNRLAFVKCGFRFICFGGADPEITVYHAGLALHTYACAGVA